MTDDQVCETVEKFGANSEECARLNASLSCLRSVHKSGESGLHPALVSWGHPGGTARVCDPKLGQEPPFVPPNLGASSGRHPPPRGGCWRGRLRPPKAPRSAPAPSRVIFNF